MSPCLAGHDAPHLGQTAGLNASSDLLGIGSLAGVDRGCNFVLACNLEFYTYFPPITSARAGQTPAFSMAGMENYASLRRFIIEPKARLGIYRGCQAAQVSKTNRTLASVCREQA